MSPSTPPGGSVTLFQNVRIFDGTGAALSPPSNVLVRGNTIAQISTAAIADRAHHRHRRRRARADAGADRRALARDAGAPDARALAGERSRLHQSAGRREATATLMRGFTTVRDLGGPAFGLKRAIDEGLVVGPRIYPSGAMITITGGHGDFRPLSDIPRTIGGMLSAHGADRRQHGRRQSGRGPRARARATHAGRVADQADGGRRRGVAAQPARRLHLHRARAARRRRGRRQLGHLRHRRTPTRRSRSSARSPPA